MNKMLTPKAFWEDYKEYLREHGSVKAWESRPIWTKLATKAAEHACRSFGYRTQREFLKIDVIGYEGPEPDYDWHLRVAFEHENSPTWREELCKLTHVAADLRVLAAFYNEKGKDPEARLREAMEQLGDRITRVPGVQWLFIFAPLECNSSTRFRAWIATDAHTISELPDDNPLNPNKWYKGST